MFGLGLTKYIPYLVYFACIVVFILTLLYKPKIGLYFLTFLIPLQNLMEKLYAFPFGKDINDILILSTLIGILIHKNKYNKVIIDKSILFPIVLFAIVSYFSLWVGYAKFGLPMPISYESKYLVQWKNFMMLPALYYITLHAVSDKKQIILIIWIMVVSTFLVGGYFYNNDVRWTDYSYYRQDLRQSIGTTFTYLGPNELAAFFTLTAMFMIGFLSLDNIKVRKLIFLGVSFFTLYCMIFLFSRGSYLASIAGLLFLGTLKNKKVLLLVFVLFIFWQTVLPKAVIERIEMTRTEEGDLESSAQSRIEMWSKAIEAVKINPITGIGFGSTELLGIENTSKGEGVRRNIHNGYLGILIEQGFLGLFIWFYVFFVAFKKGWNLFRKAKDIQMKGLGLGFLAMIVATMVDNLTGFNWFYFNVMGYFWIIFGLVTKANQINRAEAEKEKVETGQLIASV